MKKTILQKTYVLKCELSASGEENEGVLRGSSITQGFFEGNTSLS